VQNALNMAAVFPAAKMGDSVDFVAAVLGIDPTFVDGERWAQFDLGGARLSLASGTESSGGAELVVKVADVEANAVRLRELGWDVEGPVTGAHEVRVSVAGPDGWRVVMYQPLRG
jgi:hypothetical protein